MDKSKSIFWNSAMTWGLYIGFVSVLFASVLYITDNFYVTFRSWVDTAIYLVGIVLCAHAFKAKTPEGEPFPYSRALGLGIATSFFASIIVGLFYFVLYRYVDPFLIDEIALNVEELLIESGFSDQMIEQQMSMRSMMFNPPSMAIQHMFNAVFTGLLISLITSIFISVKSAEGFAEAMSEIDDENK
ncbi:MAG: DUF4199 domain-containing protein [Prolixibacteraceae bacterium]|nr:DUF4199 domain-containing protein [Prolixibacteraceae bacterium]